MKNNMKIKDNRIPKVSVITPMYNQKENYLRKCLDSLKKQSLKEIEFIIVNDGSTDQSCIKVCEEYIKNDKRFKLINQNNGGMGKAYNTGIKNALGEYIGFLESDDWAEPNMYEKLYEKAKENNVDIVKSDFYFYREVPTESNEYYCNYKPDEYNSVIDPLCNHEIFWKLPSCWSAIYRAKFIKDNNILYNETPGASYQDTSFAFIVFAKAKSFYYMSEAFVHYRIDNEASSVKSKNKIYCICDEFKFIEKFLEINPQIEEKLVYLKNYLKYYLYLWNLKRLDAKYRFQFLMHYSKEFKKEFKNKKIIKGYFSSKQYKELKFITKHPIFYYLKKKLYK